MSPDTGGITAGVIGTGNLGRNHARIYSGSEKIEKVYIFDTDHSCAEDVSSSFGAEISGSRTELLDNCDLVSVCTPATSHFEIVSDALERDLHVLVEKPLASSSELGVEMVKKARERNLVLQVGHIERFNGAFQAVLPLIKQPRFIEIHRLSTFTARGIDVSVAVDLMIHDLDLVLALLKGSELTECRCSGAGLLTDSADIVNARLEFESGCVANLTASRVSREPMRKMRIFQKDLYLSVNLRDKSVEAFTTTGDVDIEAADRDPLSFIRPVEIEIDRSEPLKKEIDSFLDAVITGSEPVVSGEEGAAALELAEMILKQVESP
ncbi:MAG: gfo/Idh/MocA family oxidoreductase [Candidatus Latescibacteria bacterium]|nr:gfo/Idh/MocA family oxidoreductase [bacterium]MBD3423395.1 gfo/Idh/MocA family oxidoreductase [Candidatus Latescibacterota bacterium]